jgi:Skp family chaperone for outer membrane proteins
MKAKLVALHQKFQHDFNDDATKMIAQFQKTRTDLLRRFGEISGVDEAAQAGADKEMDSLRKQRGDLYNEMVAQIGREVKTIAEKRGIEVVVSDVVAPAGGVDLTADAEKDIESLHE